MPFPARVRQEILLKCARHCASCRKWKATAIEVHHLVPEADGGSNEADNAIPLCFFCHDAAGADYYSPRHPRGIRYSETELRAARDRLYEDVLLGVIEDGHAPPRVDCRYVVVADRHLASEIQSGAFGDVPIDGLVGPIRNDVDQFQRSLLQTGEFAASACADQNFESWDDYFASNPDAQQLQADDDAFPYFEARRTPSADELSQFAQSHPLTSVLRQGGIPDADLLTIRALFAGCDESIIEDWSAWSPMFVFLLVRNISDRPVSVLSIDGRVETNPDESALIGFDRLKALDTVPIPGSYASIDPMSSLVIPAFTLAVPPETPEALEGEWTLPVRTETVGEFGYEKVSVSISDMLPRLERAYVVGPALRPLRIETRELNTDLIEPVHDFDPTQCWSLSSRLLLGSCPHVYGRRSRDWSYLGEVLVGRPHVELVSDLDVSEFDEILIAELEDEFCVLDVLVDGSTVARQRRLDRGETLSIDCSSGRSLQLKGYYSAADLALSADFATRKRRAAAFLVRRQLEHCRLGHMVR